MSKENRQMSKGLLLKLLKICDIKVNEKTVEEIKPYGPNIVVTIFSLNTLKDYHVYIEKGKIKVLIDNHDDTFHERTREHEFLAVALRLALKVLEGKVPTK